MSMRQNLLTAIAAISSAAPALANPNSGPFKVDGQKTIVVLNDGQNTAEKSTAFVLNPNFGIATMNVHADALKSAQQKGNPTYTPPWIEDLTKGEQSFASLPITVLSGDEAKAALQHIQNYMADSNNPEPTFYTFSEDSNDVRVLGNNQFMLTNINNFKAVPIDAKSKEYAASYAEVRNAADSLLNGNSSVNAPVIVDAEKSKSNPAYIRTPEDAANGEPWQDNVIRVKGVEGVNIDAVAVVPPVDEVEADAAAMTVVGPDSSTMALTDVELDLEAIKKIPRANTKSAVPGVSLPRVGEVGTGYILVDTNNTATIFMGHRIGKMPVNAEGLKNAVKEGEDNTSSIYTMSASEYAATVDANIRSFDVEFMDANGVTSAASDIRSQMKDVGAKGTLYSFNTNNVMVESDIANPGRTLIGNVAGFEVVQDAEEIASVSQKIDQALVAAGAPAVVQQLAVKTATVAALVKQSAQKERYPWAEARYSRVSRTKQAPDDALLFDANGIDFYVPRGEFAARNPDNSKASTTRQTPNDYVHMDGDGIAHYITPAERAEQVAAQDKRFTVLGDTAQTVVADSTAVNNTVDTPANPPMTLTTVATVVAPPPAVVEKPNQPAIAETPAVATPAVSSPTADAAQNNTLQTGHKWWEMAGLLALIGLVAGSGYALFDWLSKRPVKARILESIGTLPPSSQPPVGRGSAPKPPANKPRSRKGSGLLAAGAAAVGVAALAAAAAARKYKAKKGKEKLQVSEVSEVSPEIRSLHEKLTRPSADGSDTVTISRHDASLIVEQAARRNAEIAGLAAQVAEMRREFEALKAGTTVPAQTSVVRSITSPARVAAAATVGAVSALAAMPTVTSAATESVRPAFVAIDPALTPPPLPAMAMTPPPLPMTPPPLPSETQTPATNNVGNYYTSSNGCGIQIGNSIFTGACFDGITNLIVTQVYQNQR